MDVNSGNVMRNNENTELGTRQETPKHKGKALAFCAKTAYN